LVLLASKGIAAKEHIKDAAARVAALLLASMLPQALLAVLVVDLALFGVGEGFVCVVDLCKVLGSIFFLCLCAGDLGRGRGNI
jgi:hypothetical protein